LTDDPVIEARHRGFPVLLWLRDVAPRALPSVVARLAAAGVGVYSSTPLYMTPPRHARLVLAYASMSEEDIRAGIRQLARALPASRG
jgi:DNA-binding transcriptional MocR family regulator